MSSLSISAAWEESKAILGRDGQLYLSVALALIALPTTINTLVNPGGMTNSTPGWAALLGLVASLIGVAGQLALIRLALGPSVTVGGAIVHGLRRLPVYIASVLIIILCFLIVGVLGVTNTMLMSVFERQQEIAILLALGWRRIRIVRMILLESALLGLLGGVVGIGLGVLGIQLMKSAPAIRGLLEPDLSLNLVLIAVTIAVSVGVLSGFYPAWRSSRLTPSLALHG